MSVTICLFPPPCILLFACKDEIQLGLLRFQAHLHLPALNVRNTLTDIKEKPPQTGVQ
jgi:hypothetical protein